MRYTPTSSLPLLSLVALATVLAGGCVTPAATGPGPTNPGGGPLDSTTWGAQPFVPGPSDLSFIESTTGSRFNLFGQAYEGEYADRSVRLGLHPGMTAFWFAWSVHHPGARVWSGGINNEGIVIGSTEGCAVPCQEIRGACNGGADCIPSIDAPVWTNPSDAAALGYLVDSDRVLGLIGASGARAYPLDALWTHEIVNDTWGDARFSVTYCPLTGSGVVIDGTQDGQEMRFGVSGSLWNSNLVLYDRTTDSLYGQMRRVGFRGEELGLSLDTSAVIDTTWGAWKAAFPDTGVLAAAVGVAGYPYGDYRTDHDDTFIETNPAPDPLYPNKSYALGVTIGGETVIYAFDELQAALGARGIVQDEVGGEPVLVAFDAASQTAAVWSRRVEGEVRSFTAEAE